MRTVYTGIAELLTCAGVSHKAGRHIKEKDLSLVKDAAFVVEKEKIVWIGPRKKLKADLVKQAKHVSLNVPTLMPAFVDCHTHLLFAGNRKQEFEMRNKGISYQEIAAQGGGIKSTVRATEAASHKSLLKLAQNRVDQFLSQGVTTIEVKSGYGLSLKNETKLLAVAKNLKNARIVGTYLGPHAVPKGKNADQYLNKIITSDLVQIKNEKLASRVDMFVERGYFDLAQARRYYAKAKELGFQITAHIDQLTRSGGVKELIDFGAASLDHLVQINNSDIMSLSKSECVAVLLPTSDFYLKMAYPPARQLIDSGAVVALSTDFNPGTSPSLSISLVGVLSRLNMQMTLPEVIAAFTYGGARALNLHSTIGSLEIGKSCDFVTFEGAWDELFYQVEHHPVIHICHRGHLKNLKKP